MPRVVENLEVMKDWVAMGFELELFSWLACLLMVQRVGQVEVVMGLRFAGERHSRVLKTLLVSTSDPILLKSMT